MARSWRRIYNENHMKMWKHQDSHRLKTGVKIGSTTLENGLKVLTKLKNVKPTIQQFTSRHIQSQILAQVYQQIFTRMSTTVSVIIANTGYNLSAHQQ